jgi:hypothetical protein
MRALRFLLLFESPADKPSAVEQFRENMRKTAHDQKDEQRDNDDAGRLRRGRSRPAVAVALVSGPLAKRTVHGGT